VKLNIHDDLVCP